MRPKSHPISHYSNPNFISKLDSIEFFNSSSAAEDSYNRRLNTSSTGSANGNGGPTGPSSTGNGSSNSNGVSGGNGGISGSDFSLHDEKLYSTSAASAAAAAAAAAVANSAVPSEVASVLSPSPAALGVYPGLQKSPNSPTGSHLPDPEVFCPTSAAAAAAAAFSFPPPPAGYASAVSAAAGGAECKAEINKDN